MSVTPNPVIAKSLDLLAATPPRITAASCGLTNAQLRFKPAEDAWSANDILAHLRACADVWGKSIATMIAQDNPTIRYVSPRTWIRKTNYPEQTFDLSLHAFIQQREDLLRALKALDHAGWLRGATFTATTNGRSHTVLNYAQRIARHEGDHCEQIEALLK